MCKRSGARGGTRAVHIGVGSGPLCLGLLAEATLEAGFEVHLVGRPGGDRAPRFRRTVYRRDGSTRVESREVASFTGPGAAVPGAVRRAVADADLVLITVSLRGAVASRAGFVEAIAESCRDGCEVVFMACENTVTAAHGQLIRRLEAGGVRCPEVVVDRICFWQDGSSREREPHVVTHETAEWSIGDPAPDGLLASTLGGTTGVELVSPERIAALAARKAWMVNGVHLFAAAAGRAWNVGDLFPDLLDDSRVLGHIQLLIEAMATALALEHGLRVDPVWSLNRLRAISQLPDTCGRVLDSLSRRDTLPFIDGFDRRVCAPARVLSREGLDVFPFATAAEAVAMLLQDGSHYGDWHDLRPGELTEARDEATLLAFERALRDWAPADVASRRIFDLGDALASQRRSLPGP